jgi:hypothetical protein
METCKNCGSPVSDSADRCFTCGTDIGAPNVRAAERESAALERRYSQTIDQGRNSKRLDSLQLFQESMTKTCAVLNMDLRDLHHFVSRSRQLYTTYQLAVRSETRKAATESNDRERLSVEGLFFGTYGEKIRYGALSADGRGIKSYGEYSLRLKNVAVKDRASLLEENTYPFAKRHGMIAGSSIPAGYRSTWSERHKLAVAKLGSLVSAATTEKEYPQLLLTNGITRDSDKFIEVHIYGPMDGNAVETVTGKSIMRKQPDRGLAAEIKVYLKQAGQTWVEE